MASINTFTTKPNTLIAKEWLQALAQYAHAVPSVFISAAVPLVLGTPYQQVPVVLVASSPNQLPLCPNLASFDCVTLVETLLALRLTLKTKSNANIKDLSEVLASIRYRQNTSYNYGSRLHYFSDWLYENSNKGIIKDITKSLGGKKRKKIINWMSAHQQHYPPLLTYGYLKGILEIEAQISRRGFFYIPKNQITTIETNLQQGDIIAFTSSQKGLDVAHCGFAFQIGARQCLFHASSATGKVELSLSEIAIYAQERSDVDGVIVARML